MKKKPTNYFFNTIVLILFQQLRIQKLGHRVLHSSKLTNQSTIKNSTKKIETNIKDQQKNNV